MMSDVVSFVCLFVPLPSPMVNNSRVEAMIDDAVMPFVGVGLLEGMWHDSTQSTWKGARAISFILA